MAVSTAIILAGGLGTRLRSAVPDLPKPMAPVSGRPFLEHQFDYWIAQGVRNLVVSVGYRREVIMEHFGAAYQGASIHYAIEETPLGTGGGLLLAAAGLPPDELCLVLNGDTFFEVSLLQLAAFHEQKHADWSFALFRAEESGRYMGMDVAADGHLRSLKSGAGTPGRMANGGVYLLRPALLQTGGIATGTRCSLEDELLPALLARGSRFYGMESPGRFIDIGVPEDYRRCGELLPA